MVIEEYTKIIAQFLINGSFIFSEYNNEIYIIFYEQDYQPFKYSLLISNNEGKLVSTRLNNYILEELFKLLKNKDLCKFTKTIEFEELAKIF